MSARLYNIYLVVEYRESSQVVKSTQVTIYEPHLTEYQELKTHRSGISTGAIKLQMYRRIHVQLETTRIHIATSDLPM